MDSESELLPKNGVLQLCCTVFIHPHLTDVKLKLCIIRGMGGEKNLFSDAGRTGPVCCMLQVGAG